MIFKSTADMTVEMVPPSLRGEHPCCNCENKLSVKYKVTNPVTKESRYFCNMCYLKLMADFQRVDKMMNDSFYQMPTFIRFGKIPEDKRSTIHYHSIEVGKEEGLSVYHGVKIGDTWHIAYPNPSNENTNCTFECFVGGQGPGVPRKDQVILLVTGRVIGTGCDGEPLIDHVRVLEDLSDKFVYDKDYDRAYEIAQMTSTEDPTKTNYDIGCDKYVAEQKELERKMKENV